MIAAMAGPWHFTKRNRILENQAGSEKKHSSGIHYQQIIAHHPEPDALSPKRDSLFRQSILKPFEHTKNLNQ
ncbi:MAG: hypothetical protein GXP57_07605 [Deltaproteobacteria bacterium]|nr:hypothetical protein [Deltaproteobacteria bacterium]